MHEVIWIVMETMHAPLKAHKLLVKLLAFSHKITIKPVWFVGVFIVWLEFHEDVVVCCMCQRKNIIHMHDWYCLLCLLHILTVL